MPSSDAVIPLVQGGYVSAITGTSGIHYERCTRVQRTPPSDVTGTSGGTHDKVKKFVQGVPIVDYVFTGNVQPSGNVDLGQAATFTINTATFRALSWQFRKVWPLFNVTSGTTVSEFTWGIPTYVFSCSGIATGNDGPVSDTASVSTLTITSTQLGTVALAASGSFKINQFASLAHHQVGGPQSVTVSGVYSGGVAYTGTNFSWLFPSLAGSNIDNPVRDAFTWDTSGEVITKYAIAYDVAFQFNANTGGKTLAVVRGRQDYEAA